MLWIPSIMLRSPEALLEAMSSVILVVGSLFRKSSEHPLINRPPARRAAKK